MFKSKYFQVRLWKLKKGLSQNQTLLRFFKSGMNRKCAAKNDNFLKKRSHITCYITNWKTLSTAVLVMPERSLLKYINFQFS